jgi:SAM-dependent methyltransferase
MADNSKKPAISRPKLNVTKKTVKIDSVPTVLDEPTVAEPILAKPTLAKPTVVIEPTLNKTGIEKPRSPPRTQASRGQASQESRQASQGQASQGQASRPHSRGETTVKKYNDRDLHELYSTYLKNVTKSSVNEELELEVKFGTLGVAKSITRINYDNVMKKLLSSGFTVDSNVYLLRIQNEYMDPRTGGPRLSNIRTEINGLQNIRKYCQTNSLETIDTGISYIEKSQFNRDSSSSVDINDYNFRVSLSKEVRLDKNVPMVRTTLDKWNDRKKTFRFLTRTKLRHPTLPVVIDMSTVKDSKRQGRNYIPEYNIHDSGVFNAAEKYEIEIECINSLVGMGTAFHTPDLLNTDAFKPVIKYVLSGLQETNYPISYPELKTTLQSYMKLLWGKEYVDNMRVEPSNFVGPSSYTLELKNILPVNPDAMVPNIRENYTVTDKADGERKLLFIAPNGKIYLINSNMEVQFTGTLSKNKDLWNTLLDGEHIVYDKKKKFINMYAAFDIYYVGGEDIRSKGFVPQNTEEVSTNYRLPILETIVDRINPVSVVNEKAPIPLKITKKRFYMGTATQSIFQGCSYILTKEHDGLFEYETDGLIFTPANMGVGAKIGEKVKPEKISWEYSFKWKPSKFNTVDFMISVKKNESGTDIIGSTFNNGVDFSSSEQIAEYKTVILRVGFDEKKHGYVNPYQDAIEDKLPTFINYEDRRKNTYAPLQFYPTEPSDYKAGICNIPLNGTDKKMYTENQEIIEDNMIVEFSYDPSKEEQWRWIPLRVRYDKTAQLREGEKMFGNSFQTANNVWHTIHHPITQVMLMTGENIPEDLGDDDVYYNKGSGETGTGALRNFHNLYVKSLLIKSIAKPGGTLIDLAVGKGGDWPKWIEAKQKFVFGVDISRDNIQNRLDGAYARYLNNKKRYRVMPAALFVNGNSSLNIKKTTGILIDKDKQITRAVFGQGPKDAKVLGQGVYKQYGVAADGFDVTSIQFAIHYMFESQETLQNFLQNVSEVTKEGGYFIGTSYDGEKLFNMLKKIPENESKVIMSENNKKIWELTKRYDRAEFNDDETCVGYAVDVFQDSINKTFREYLVNYTYLTRVLENYGFVLASTEDLRNLRAEFKAPTGFFADLFNKMNDDIKQNPSAAASYKDAPLMTDGERTISFLNRYFIYKKVRKISDAEKVALNLQHKTADEVMDEARGSLTAKQSVTKALASEAAQAAAPTAVKSRTIRPKKASEKPKLSTIGENTPTAATAALPVEASTAPENIYAMTEPSVKKPVKSLKRTLKVVEKTQ